MSGGSGSARPLLFPSRVDAGCGILAAVPANEPETVCVRVVVHGRVQGVAFRMFTRQEALRLGVRGWVRNRPDRTVEATFEGPAEAVSAAVEWCQRGPSWARVDRVETTREPAAGLEGFAIR